VRRARIALLNGDGLGTMARLATTVERVLEVTLA
jgi:hypothetical protein